MKLFESITDLLVFLNMARDFETGID